MYASRQIEALGGAAGEGDDARERRWLLMQQVDLDGSILGEAFSIDVVAKVVWPACCSCYARRERLYLVVSSRGLRKAASVALN
jgi:hypothetical protein